MPDAAGMAHHWLARFSGSGGNEKSMGKIIGIDLGHDQFGRRGHGGRAAHSDRQESGRTTSFVAFTKSGERLVGQVAKRQSITNPREHRFLDQTVYGPPL